MLLEKLMSRKNQIYKLNILKHLSFLLAVTVDTEFCHLSMTFLPDITTFASPDMLVLMSLSKRQREFSSSMEIIKVVEQRYAYCGLCAYVLMDLNLVPNC